MIVEPVVKKRGDDMVLAELKHYIEAGAIKWSVHCLERMQERDISRNDVKNCILCGEIIEDYPDDFPHPSCMIFGMTVEEKVIHVVAGCDGESLYVITAYYPNTEKFEADLKTRRRR